MLKSTPTKHDGRAVLFAVAELLVYIAYGIKHENYDFAQTVAYCWQSWAYLSLSIIEPTDLSEIIIHNA